ncbi:MAG: DUF5683 domain-containing protein [Bacteroidota bacterium]
MKKQLFVYFIVLLACIGGGAKKCAAQARPDTSLNNIVDDTVRRRKAVADTSTPAIKMRPMDPNPKRAGLYSALLPGLGQIYNRQYWKLPIVYGGLAVAGYFFVDNLKQYQSFRKAYIGRINNPHPTDEYVDIYTPDQLHQLQDDYNRYLNLTALFTGLGYMLQVVDAITSAHLRNFDISRDISMRVTPVATPQGLGLGMVVNFK